MLTSGSENRNDEFPAENIMTFFSVLIRVKVATDYIWDLDSNLGDVSKSLILGHFDTLLKRTKFFDMTGSLTKGTHYLKLTIHPGKHF